MRKTKTYKSWDAMKQRILNPNNIGYKQYQTLGISICDRWLLSFENFLEDMGERPEGLTLDRIDNNKGYYPDNCRWATYSQQAYNRRSKRIFKAQSNNKSSTIPNIHAAGGGFRIRFGTYFDKYVKNLDEAILIAEQKRLEFYGENTHT